MKKQFKKIALILLAYLAITSIAGPIYSAFAFSPAGADGKCADPLVRVVGAPTDEPCLENTSANNLTVCESNPNLYYLNDNKEMCPAAGGDVGESLTAQQTIEKFLALIITLEKLLNKLLWPILFLIGDLLKTDILFGSGMEDRLYNIWVPVRNLVNIIFVLGLVGLALYSVLGISGEQSNYSIKTMLPKLIAGIIAVNFSFIAIKVFLDVVNVFTTSIFAIPTQIESMEGTNLGSKDHEELDTKQQGVVSAFCKQVYSVQDYDSFGESLEGTALQKLAQEFKLPMLTDTKQITAVAAKFDDTKKGEWNARLLELKEFSMCEGVLDTGFKLTDTGQKFFAKYASNNAALAMAINMGEIVFYDKAATGAMGSNKYESLAINAIFSLLLYLVYVVSFVVLFIVLLARLVVLWLGIAISPVMALILTVPIAKEKLSSVEPLIGKFVSHAIAPIPIALSMTVGWIMLNGIKSTMLTNTGSAMASGVLIPSIPIPGLMISLATVAVVWLGVFAAANETIAGGMTKVVQDKLQSFGKFVATAPIKYTPWVPVEVQGSEDPERLSISGISQVIGNASGMLDSKARDKAKRVLNMNTPDGAEAIVAGMGHKKLEKVLGGMTKEKAKEEETWKRVRGLKNDSTVMDALQAGEGWEQDLYKAIKNDDKEAWEKAMDDHHNKRLKKIYDDTKKKTTPEEKAKDQAKAAEEAKEAEKALEASPTYKAIAEITNNKAEEGATEIQKKATAKKALDVVEAAATLENHEGTAGKAAFENQIAIMKRDLQEPFGVDGAKAKELLTARIEETYKGDDKAGRIAIATAWIEKNWDPPASDTTPPAPSA